ncbi:MAG TPA: arsenite methyltransferase [Bdellovibrionota bacterium]|nr:arsenite methyltransferase [Bdellovibrionota bacterium]
MKKLNADKVRTAVRENYAEVAKAGGAAGCGCSASTSSCCGGTSTEKEAGETSRKLGYSEDDLAKMPPGANMGLGCGNPQAIASIRPGDIVLDLGSGGGFDAFLAVRQTGLEGRVIGVDMTPEMIALARKNAQKLGLNNVEFRLGEIEALPVLNDSIDVIISNCVINLSPEKMKVFREAVRVLKPGGRLAVSDVVASAKLPNEIKSDIQLLSGCISGASEIGELESMLKTAGFEEIRITPKEQSREFIRDWAPGRKLEDYVVSADIQAQKPKNADRGCCGPNCCG